MEEQLDLVIRHAEVTDDGKGGKIMRCPTCAPRWVHYAKVDDPERPLLRFLEAAIKHRKLTAAAYATNLSGHKALLKDLKSRPNGQTLLTALCVLLSHDAQRRPGKDDMGRSVRREGDYRYSPAQYVNGHGR